MAPVLERLSEAVAGHVPGGDVAGHLGDGEDRFHTLNRATGNRVQAGMSMRRLESRSGRGSGKGLELAEGDYVTLEDEELDGEHPDHRH